MKYISRTMKLLNRLQTLGVDADEVCLLDSAMLEYVGIINGKIEIAVTNRALKVIASYLNKNICVNEDDPFLGVLETEDVTYRTMLSEDKIEKEDIQPYMQNEIWVNFTPKIKRHRTSIFESLSLHYTALSLKLKVMNKMIRRNSLRYGGFKIIKCKIDYDILKLILTTEYNEEIVIKEDMIMPV